MTTRKKKPDVEIDQEILDVEQALQAVNDSGRCGYCDLNERTIGRLVHSVAELGGVVSFWNDRNNGRLGYSVRIGKTYKSYNVETPTDFDLSAERVVSTLTPLLLSRKRKPPLPPLSEDTEIAL